MENIPVFSFGQARERSLGILGGTFDPIHLGHLYVARQALAGCGLDKVVFLPADTPPHKRWDGMAPFADRWAMVCRAIYGQPGMAVSDFEVQHQGCDYTVDTLSALKDIIPPGCRLHFIIGADSLLSIENWHDPVRLLGLVPFIAVYRPGKDAALLKQACDSLQARYGAHIILLCCAGVDISSTRVRERVRTGESLEGWVPPTVAEYIARKGLYQV